MTMQMGGAFAEFERTILSEPTKAGLETTGQAG
jgi:DNA invertase Pin-like site-specific DNA recombinase